MLRTAGGLGVPEQAGQGEDGPVLGHDLRREVPDAFRGKPAREDVGWFAWMQGRAAELGDAFHFKAAIGCNVGARCRRLARSSQCLKSRRLAETGHRGWLPPHHFPDDQPTNP